LENAHKSAAKEFDGMESVKYTTRERKREG